MKILLIGGTGFISTRLREFLLADGHEVTIVTRGIMAPDLNPTERLHIFQCDRENTTQFQNKLGSATWDIVYDMAAYDSRHSKSAYRMFSGKIGWYIHCSTISVYMISNHVTCPVTEDQSDLPVMPLWDRNPFGMDYGIKKRECEKVLWNFHDDLMFPVTCIRPTYVSGPGDPARRDYFWIERILDGGPLLVPGSGDFAFQQVFVDDVARLFTDLLKNPKCRGEAYNVAAEEIFSLKEYLYRLALLLEKEIEIVTCPQKDFDRLDIGYDPAGDVFPFNTRRTAIFSLAKVKNDIGYRSTPFDNWMRNTIKWFTRKETGPSNGYGRRRKEIEICQKLDQFSVSSLLKQ